MAKNVLPLVSRLHRAKCSLNELQDRLAPPVVIELAKVNVAHLTRLVHEAVAKSA